MRFYDDPDKMTKDLIETNIRQRGTIGGSDMKMGRIIKELERIYGVRSGSAGSPITSCGWENTSETRCQELNVGQEINSIGLKKEARQSYQWNFRKCLSLAKLTLTRRQRDLQALRRRPTRPSPKTPRQTHTIPGTAVHRSDQGA